MPLNCKCAAWYPPTKDICCSEKPPCLENVQSFAWTVVLKCFNSVSSSYTQNWLRPPISTSWRGRCFSQLLKTQQKVLVCFLAVVLIQALLKLYPQVRMSPWLSYTSAQQPLLTARCCKGSGLQQTVSFMNKLWYKCSKDHVIVAH